MKKILELNHHLDDYECMWNGIEDLYMNETKEKIPDQFFFAMSGFCSFAYIKTNKSDIKRMVSFGDGRTKKMYEYLSDIVGFKYHFIESNTASIALNKAKKEIDNNYPVVIGAFDMYYLEYYKKLYHKEHIPFHYFLMIGYSDELEKVYLYDCGRKDIQELSYENVLLGMNAEYPGLCKKNTICTIRMDKLNSKKDIMKKCLKDKADMYVNPKTNFLGINGINKLIKELPNWDNELGKEETDKILRSMVEFMGTVPGSPNKLLGINKQDELPFMCSRDKFSRVLKELSKEYNSNELEQASRLFLESGKEFQKLCNIFVDYLVDNKEYKNESVLVLNKIGELEYNAYKIILDCIDKI